MRSYRQRLLNKLAALRALLRREARADSDYLTASTFSLVSQDVQKRTPSGIKNAFRQLTARQPCYIQVLHDDNPVCVGVVLRCLEVEVAPLAVNLQVGLRYAARRLAASATALYAGAQPALLAPQSCPAGAIVARVLYRIPVTVGKEYLQPNVNTDSGAVVVGMREIGLRGQRTYNLCVPVTVSPLDQVACPGRTFYLAMPLDFNRLAKFGRDSQVSPVNPSIIALAPLPQVDTMPLITALKAREALPFRSLGKERLQRLRQTIRQARHSRGGDGNAASTLKHLGQVVLAQKFARLLLMLLHALQHLIIELARNGQARIKTAALISVWVEAKCVRSHNPIVLH